MEIVYIILQ